MSVLLLLIFGGGLGYASALLASGGRRDVFPNVILGMLGALTTSLALAPMLGGPTFFGTGVSALSLMFSTIGALIVLAVYNLFRLQEA